LYTQCSKCETVFKLSAEVLRAASGQVRCGKCGEVFNALARLAEDANAFAAGESQLDLETRADSILRSGGALRVAKAVVKDEEDTAPPGVEIAQLEVLDWVLDDQEPPEEDKPPVKQAPASPPPASPTPASTTPASTTPVEEPVDDELDRSMEFTLPPGELDRIFVEPKVRAPHLAPPAGSTVSGFDVSEEVRREVRDQLEQTAQPAVLDFNLGRDATQHRAFGWWLSAAIVSALLLAAQVIHQNRVWLVDHTHGPIGGGLRALYGALGAPFPAPANLSAYQLRQWGVTGDPQANSTLRVRASILNASAQLQPYPLLRVTLADRFGKGIGTRDFEAAEYMGKPVARLLAPGERVDATLEILDPGKNAEGFEIDVCLRGTDQRIACASDVAPQTKQ
jgi:predicted Zn finger-like uncharacterized protein